MICAAGSWRLDRDDKGRRLVTGGPSFSVRGYVVSIVIRRGLASSRFGSSMIKTPSL